MGKINSKTQYPFDTNISENDYLIGTDGDTSNKKTKNFAVSDLVRFIQEETQTIPSDGSWVYSCDGDEYEFGDFYTPNVCYTGNDDPNISDLDTILISTKTIEEIEAARYLRIAENGGVMMMLINKADLNNFFIIKDPVFGTGIDIPAGYAEIGFTDAYWSKSFKQGDAYNVRFFFTSNFTPGLYKETNLSSTDDPTTPPDGGVHIGKEDAVQVLKTKIVLNKELIELPLLGSATLGEDDNQLFVLGFQATTKMMYVMPFNLSQPKWTEEDSSTRYFIKDRFPQKEINTNYTIQPSDNGHTIFVNNGSGDVVIEVDKNTGGMEVFRECRFIQKGTGDVTIVQATGGPQYVFAAVSGNKIGGRLKECTLVRQVSIEDEVETLGDFYLLNTPAAVDLDWTQEDA